MSGLLDKLGVKVEDMKSSPLKAEPSGVPADLAGGARGAAAVVNDTYDWFKSLVATRRQSARRSSAPCRRRVFNGRQALPLKLVDELGGEREAIAWLEREKGVAKDLPVRDWRPRGDRATLDLWTCGGRRRRRPRLRRARREASPRGRFGGGREP